MMLLFTGSIVIMCCLFTRIAEKKNGEEVKPFLNVEIYLDQ